MNAVPTDDLRVVKKKTETVMDEGPLSRTVLIGPAQIVAVQRRWLVWGQEYRADKKRKESDGVAYATNAGWTCFVEQLEEWRDLPEVEL